MLFGPDRSCAWYSVMKWACAKIMILVNQNQVIRPSRQQTIHYKTEVVIWDWAFARTRWHKQPTHIGSLRPPYAHPLLHKCLLSSHSWLCGVSIITNWQKREKPSLLTDVYFGYVWAKWMGAALEADHGKTVIRKNLRWSAHSLCWKKKWAKDRWNEPGMAQNEWLVRQCP